MTQKDGRSCLLRAMCEVVVITDTDHHHHYAHLIIVTTITTAGRVKKFSQVKIFPIGSEKTALHTA